MRPVHETVKPIVGNEDHVAVVEDTNDEPRILPPRPEEIVDKGENVVVEQGTEDFKIFGTCYI